MFCPGANNVAGGTISAANGLYIYKLVPVVLFGHFLVISLIQPRHTINNYLRTTGEQAGQGSGLLLVISLEFLDTGWPVGSAS